MMMHRFFNNPLFGSVDWTLPNPWLKRELLPFDAPLHNWGGLHTEPGPKFSSYPTDSGVALKADVPGLSEKDIQIEVTGNKMTVTGEKHMEAPEGYEKRLSERPPMKFSKTFSVAKDLDPEHIDAEIKNGVLTLQIPKRPEAEPRKIDVKAA